MPIRVRYQNDTDQECTVRPTPLVSVSTNILKDGAGEAFGITYTLTLTGKLIADQGTPYAVNHVGVPALYPFHNNAPTADELKGPYSAFDNAVSHTLGNKPSKQQIDHTQASAAISQKQRALRALFAQDGQRMEVTDWNNDLPTFVCFPRLVGDIVFSEGVWVDTCDFTITLECDTILFGQGDDVDLIVDDEGSLITRNVYNNKTEATLLASLSGAFINDYGEDWSIEVDDAIGESPENPRSYRITHNINATGKTHYTPAATAVEKLPAWEQARKFVQNRLADNITDYPNVMGKIGSGTINLVNSYGGFNHVRSENISESAGTYSVSETWLIASGSAYENYSSTTSSSSSDSFVNVAIEGRIQGLTSISPSGYGGGGTTAFDNAQSKYNAVSNSGAFGLNSSIYQRVNNLVAVQMNSQPLSISVASNNYAGEISYNASFDNRPTNIISGVLSESISINDGYPGDVFSIIPVIGRATGPVLQYIGGRTEYTRDLGIELVMDYTKIPYGSGRNPLLLKKPSVIEPTASQIADLIKELSPQGEPGVRKYFIKPPTESWSPKTGAYSFNISWVYELDT
jgi:hypothetical protein